MIYAIIGGILLIIGYAILTYRATEEPHEEIKHSEESDVFCHARLETVQEGWKWRTTIVCRRGDDMHRIPCAKRRTKHESRELAFWFAGKNDIDIDGLIERG